tara:strand:+ start:4102 stop:4473 length:372 start_codon:yes stop_codon:yes gene_type:complete
LAPAAAETTLSTDQWQRLTGLLDTLEIAWDEVELGMIDLQEGLHEAQRGLIEVQVGLDESGQAWVEVATQLGSLEISWVKLKAALETERARQKTISDRLTIGLLATAVTALLGVCLGLAGLVL